jgi:hypothetical protein
MEALAMPQDLCKSGVERRPLRNNCPEQPWHRVGHQPFRDEAQLHRIRYRVLQDPPGGRHIPRQNVSICQGTPLGRKDVFDQLTQLPITLTY